MSHRTINRNVECEGTYSKIRDWLTTCHMNHSSCRPYLATARDVLPALVLDVSPMMSQPDTIKLLRVRNQNISYAALTYCWGAKQPNATTRSNLQAYLNGIKLSLLPQSLRDAVIVTRKLSLRYLWVDSLCIIQDLEGDKTHEIGRMEYIYSNAYVTISASSSADCNSGFLEMRKQVKESIMVPFCSEKGEIGGVTLSPIRCPETKDYLTPHEPINYRAWTFQESFLSPRMLIYSKYQLFWVCGETWGRDGGRISREEYFPNELSVRRLKSPQHSDWRLVVRQYLSRNLTDPSDKLLALSSIASYFAMQMNDKYLAGLWASNLLRDLCWHPEYLRGVRPPRWRAPSWSFMSLEGEIKFIEEKRLRFNPRKSRTDLGCTILSCVVVPLSQEAPFGQVASGILKVRGRLIKVRTWSSAANSIRNSEERPMIIDNSKGEYQGGDLKFDTVVRYKDNQSNTIVNTSYGVLDLSNQLWCLMLCTVYFIVVRTQRNFEGDEETTGYEVWRPWGLTLARLPNGIYHRVGHFVAYLDTIEEFRKQASQELTIV